MSHSLISEIGRDAKSAIISRKLQNENRGVRRAVVVGAESDARASSITHTHIHAYTHSRTQTIRALLSRFSVTGVF